jgi:hypothetical protein
MATYCNNACTAECLPYFNFERISSEGTSSVAPAWTLSGFTTAKQNCTDQHS